MIGAGLDPARVEAMGRDGSVAEKRAANQATTGAMVAASADTAQRESAVSLQRLDRLVGEIPQQTGIKEAIDLNTRMMGEAVSELIKNKSWSRARRRSAPPRPAISRMRGFRNAS